VTLADRLYRTEAGDELVDERTGERRVVVQIQRAEDIRLGDLTGYSARAMEVNALWAGGRRRGPFWLR
jgi:hypothetical protein